MSYDLYFHKKKESLITKIDVENFLSLNLCEEENNQWVFQNPDTEVYFIFEKTENLKEEEEFSENFENFDNLDFTFILNFLRPSFFGIEAFQFIEKIVNELDLYVFNPQSDNESPYKPAKAELFENWNSTNLSSSSKHFSEQCSYLEIEKSNTIWNYNFYRGQIQNNLGNAYYFLLTKIQKRLFKTKQENVLISRETLISTFGDYFEDYDFVNCKIINPRKC